MDAWSIGILIILGIWFLGALCFMIKGARNGTCCGCRGECHGLSQALPKKKKMSCVAHCHGDCFSCNREETIAKNIKKE